MSSLFKPSTPDPPKPAVPSEDAAKKDAQDKRRRILRDQNRGGIASTMLSGPGSLPDKLSG